MNERKQGTAFRHAVDKRLSGLEGDPWLTQRVLANVKGEVKVKKKISAGFVLVLVLALVTVTALAAIILNSKDFVDQVMAPMAQKDNKDTWSSEQTDEILRLAEENGIKVNDDIRRRVETSDAVHKAELMRAFAKIDLGFYPAAWSLADQAWYDELLVKCGLLEERTRFLPEKGEISEAEAVETAIQFVTNKLDRDVDLSLTDAYTRYVQYMLTEDGDGNRIKMWDINFDSTSGKGPSFSISILSDGTVIEDESYKRLPAPESQYTSEQISSIDELAKLITQDDFYTVDNLAHFSERYATLINSMGDMQGTKYSVLRNLLKIPYGEPTPNNISENEAFELGKKAALEKGWTDTWLQRCKYSISYRVYDPLVPEWRICFKIGNIENYKYFHDGEMPFGIVINLNAQNGTVLRVQQLDEMDKYDFYCEFPDARDSFESKSNGVG